ncbi:MAG: hypothetical protein JSU71_12585 [Betaproteobacteria bacterium]|nr:MAG: hypothetical protein JSU71_12585 [Betaproteobacteria bacterium]
MGRFDFIWQYVGACIGGQLPSSECAPLWQFGIIILLLVFAVAGLIVIRLLTGDDPRPLSAGTPRRTAQSQKRTP